ncbi:surface antigen BspA-like [Trichomonas vaginalis G3]|uniref:Surface antigen BspA-like n=1 Tax=Trichomonas vaginalis (strain ATCC PRA-98 / G3) TaxID=412133 RepID=A2DEI7_TRIV3|nr:ribonuclease inhibitor domain-containing protein [Trichomonas vaginalis G3]EAY21114.1 surface antigen BspA-like [Trichomonas vaginalis G3]KAI5539947.1 ribonuclease inhibitor domain-containing protein [Trichomonas vaginalis G3]|eukprot:XP_001582100.1 surface antigen BspA-like [Trichomonas vaginalis G3]
MHAFANSGLTTANLANSIATVGLQAFFSSKVTEITISCTIPQEMCRLCDKLTTLNLRGNVESIGKFAFYKCSSLTGFTIPSDLKRIYDFAFQSCTSLSDIRMEMDGNLQSIEGGCFYDCPNLRSITLNPDDRRFLFENGALTYYNKSKLIVFLPYSGIKNFIVPMDMEEIGSCAFMGSPSLIRVFFNGNKIKDIGYQSFKDCPNLNLIFFSSPSLKTIGADAFKGCPLLSRCGAFSVPASIQNTFINAGIPQIAFSDDCDLINSCKIGHKIAISPELLFPFIYM